MLFHLLSACFYAFSPIPALLYLCFYIFTVFCLSSFSYNGPSPSRVSFVLSILVFTLLPLIPPQLYLHFFIFTVYSLSSFNSNGALVPFMLFWSVFFSLPLFFPSFIPAHLFLCFFVCSRQLSAVHPLSIHSSSSNLPPFFYE